MFSVAVINNGHCKFQMFYSTLKNSFLLVTSKQMFSFVSFYSLKSNTDQKMSLTKTRHKELG